MRVIKLKERGVYTLPDGRELIASRISNLGCCLYSPQTWKNYGIAEYRIHSDGRLMSKGVPTRWRIEDLKDTGREIK
jgi:hypothetical protein